MKKRVLAFLLTLCMLITLVPAESMLATEAQAEIGTETEANIESEVDEEKKGQEGMTWKLITSLLATHIPLTKI